MVLLLPLTVWQPIFLLGIAACLTMFVYLNKSIFEFFLKEKGLLFTTMALPWQLLYFLYSGVSFVACWFIFALPATLRSVRREVG